ncbi:MAG: vanadium-dependent haloperoxidase [Chitinophagaceae bacterium]
MVHRFVAAIVAVVMLNSCSTNGDYLAYTHDPILYCKTVKKLNNIVLENNFPPMIGSRNYVYANIAAYEVVAAGDDSSYRSLAGQIESLPPTPKWTGGTIDYPLAALLAFIKVGNAVTFPEGSMTEYFDDLIKQAKKAGMPEDMRNNAKQFAEAVADHIMAWAKKDNYAQTRSAEKYSVRDEDGRWVPTPPMYAQGLESHWNEIRTLALDSCSECMPPRPPKYNIRDTGSTFYRLALEVKKIGDSLDKEQKHIADFWDDNPFKLNVTGHVMFATKKFSPPGHWMNIVGIAAQKAGSDFNTTVYAYTKTAVALFDGFISCWDEKYRSNLVRPETVINKYIDPDWTPYLQTPPFPSYVSGHSVISAAAAEVMTDIYGDHFSFRDTSSTEFGIAPRSFTSFRQAAQEASISRLYGGIHYRIDLDAGNIQGTRVGRLVVDRLKLKKPQHDPILSINTPSGKKLNYTQ